jgi:hypothetical protein
MASSNRVVQPDAVHDSSFGIKVGGRGRARQHSEQYGLGGHPKPAIDGQLKTGHRR